ncbi:MAG: purine-nucleoside phosphorylase [Bryobacteraceae bacterium]|nr:purine-nucleoside phosphorylase [Bryobacteraceae bacterium]
MTFLDIIRDRTSVRPRVGVVLGSGLGGFAQSVNGAVVIPYHDLPCWPKSTAIGHAGQLVFGDLAGTPVMVMSGRAHFYEGYSMREVTFGVRAMRALGVRSVVFTNAAGGINLSYAAGKLVLISDHINLQGANPLMGPNDDALGPRFPDMSDAYSAAYRDIARAAAAELGIGLGEGVYAALTGPSYETPAEIRYLRAIGADLVGMSTAPEVIVANWLGMKCLAISCVTNMAAGVLPQPIDHQEVLETGARVRDTLVKLLTAVIPKLG